MNYLVGLPAFASFFAMGVGFLAVFLLAYLYLTPHRELALIRAGNLAAATAVAGAVLGDTMPLARALMQSANATDLAVWAMVALVAQIAAYVLVRLLLPSFPTRIEAGDRAAALLSASLHVAVGVLNGAAMAY